MFTVISNEVPHLLLQFEGQVENLPVKRSNRSQQFVMLVDEASTHHLGVDGRTEVHPVLVEVPVRSRQQFEVVTQKHRWHARCSCNRPSFPSDIRNLSYGFLTHLICPTLNALIHSAVSFLRVRADIFLVPKFTLLKSNVDNKGCSQGSATQCLDGEKREIIRQEKFSGRLKEGWPEYLFCRPVRRGGCAGPRTRLCRLCVCDPTLAVSSWRRWEVPRGAGRLVWRLCASLCRCRQLLPRPVRAAPGALSPADVGTCALRVAHNFKLNLSPRQSLPRCSNAYVGVTGSDITDAQQVLGVC